MCRRAPERLAHAQPGRALGRPVADLVAVPVAPQVRLERHLAEAVDGIRKAALEGQSPHLAVGHDVDARLLLQADGAVNGPILGRFQLGRGRLAPVEPLAHLEQVRRPQQAPDDVGVGGDHGRECSQALRAGMPAL